MKGAVQSKISRLAAIRASSQDILISNQTSDKQSTCSECVKHPESSSTYPDAGYNKLARDLNGSRASKCFRCIETHCHCDCERQCQSCQYYDQDCSYPVGAGKHANPGKADIDGIVPLNVFGLISKASMSPKALSDPSLVVEEIRLTMSLQCQNKRGRV